MIADSHDQHVANLLRSADEQRIPGDAFDQTGKSMQSSELVYSIGDASNHLHTGTKPTSKFESPSTASPLRPQTVFAG